MIQKITTLKDVAEFTRLRNEEGVNVHPDTDFRQYVHTGSGTATYTADEAALRNLLMAETFTLCEADKIGEYGAFAHAVSCSSEYAVE